MAVGIHREGGNIVIVIEDFVRQTHAAQLAEELGDAVQRFVNTDAETQILIREMVKEAFKGIDLLKVVTETVVRRVDELTKPAT